MKRKVNFSEIIAACILFIGTVCGCSDKKEMSAYSECENSISQTVCISENIAAGSAYISEASANNNAVSESAEHREKQIVDAVCTDIYGYVPVFDEKNNMDHSDYLINTAESIPERVLGNIDSEEDAIEKARDVWTERLGTDFIEKIESDYVESDGGRVKYQRDHPPYNVTFYEEYDVWLINPNYPSGITEDGRQFSTPGMTPYLIIRGSDGKILGALI
ncbi:MAG: hypothetical protein ACI4I9_03900 [Porcipelethomonas sp.]